MKNIVSFCFVGFPGTNTTLRNLAQTVRLSRHFGLTSAAPDSPEITFFAEYLRETKPALVIFGAWTPAYERLLDALHPHTMTGVYWTSSSGQMDIAGETALLGMILEHPRLRFKFFPRWEIAAALRHRRDCFELLSTLPVSAARSPRRLNAVPIISLFCSPNEYRRKNILNSLLAVGMQAQPYILHLNGLSEHPDYRRILGICNVHYHDWGWMPAQQYRRVLGRVDIGLQVSFSESFDYVAAEHMERGIPVIGSRMVPALDAMPARVVERCVVNNPDDPIEIAYKLEYLLAHPPARRSLGESARRRLIKINEENIYQAKALLQHIVPD